MVPPEAGIYPLIVISSSNIPPKQVVGGSSNEGVDAVELSVAKAGSAMREVAVASAPADAAATEIAAMLKRKNLKKKKEVKDAFTGEYVPLDPLDWRAKGR